MEDYSVPEPLVFNPLKHYLPYIKDFVNSRPSSLSPSFLKDLIRELKHIGTCVMDVYSGSLPVQEIFNEASAFLSGNNLYGKEIFASWAGRKFNEYKIVSLSDTSLWTMKYHENENRYVHIFPARSSPFTFRVKANTLKSAILYLIIVGKDYVTEDDLNRARAMAGLSPVKDVAETEAVTEMIDIIRD